MAQFRDDTGRLVRGQMVESPIAGAKKMNGGCFDTEKTERGESFLPPQCGKFIGARTLAVATGGSKLEELKNHAADWTVADLTKITAREICE